MTDATDLMTTERDLKKEYAVLTKHRTERLRQARDNSAYTIPALMPEDGHNETTVLPQPWQSVGARGFNNLTSRILLTLFPPNTANWRGTIPQARLEESGLTKEEASQFDAALSGLEQEFRRDFEASGDRSTLYEMLRTHLVTGDVIARMLPTGLLRYYKLDQFGVSRDLDGNLLMFIIQETIAFKALPAALREVIGDKDDNGLERTTVDVYTIVQRDEGEAFEEAQYVEGKLVKGSTAAYPSEDRMPWRVLRHTKVPGENHGRAFADDIHSDLKSLDSLTQSVVEGVAIMVKSILFIKAGSPIQRAQLQKAKNGDVLIGNADDVSVFRIEKVADLTIAINFIERIEQRLGMSFLMNTSVQRNAERVTAEEIRFMAQELEAALGGFYSRLATELQVWYIRQRLAIMEKTGKAPKLPKNLVDIQIITGVDALGRRTELDNLDVFLVGVLEKFGPEVFKNVVNLNEYLRRRAAALGLDTRTLINEDATTQDLNTQDANAALVNKVAPEAVRQLGPQLVPPPQG